MKEIKTHTLEELNKGQFQFTDYGLMCENLKLLKEQDVYILHVGASITEDKRLLIPIEHNRKLGLINHFAQVVVQPLYDDINVYDLNNCSTEDDLLRVTKKCNIVDYENMCTYEDMEAIGVINARGIQVLPTMYRYISINDTKNIFTVQRLKPYYGYGVRGLYNKEIIPFGKFYDISHFVKGFARAKNSKGWVIIDIQGNEIIEGGIFSNIWALDSQYNSIVVEKSSTRYTISYEDLEDLRQELLANGCITTSPDSLLSYQTHIQGDFPLIGETIFTI